MQKGEAKKYDFSDIDTIITDSQDLLKFAYNHKLPKKTKIFSTSPKIFLNKSLPLINLKEKYSISKNIKLKNRIKVLLEKITLFLEKDSEKKVLTGIAMREICSLIPMYERCLLLESLDFKKKILVIEHENYKTHYGVLFSGFSNVKFIILRNNEVKIKKILSDKYLSKYLPRENVIKFMKDYFRSFKEQWLISKWMCFFYPFSKCLWRVINLLRLKKGFLIINDSSLIRETACWLTIFRQPFIHERFLIEDIYQRSKNEINDSGLQKKLEKIFKKHFQDLFEKNLVEAISKISSHKISIHYNSMKKIIPKYNELIEKKKIKGAISVIFKNVSHFTFYEALKKKNIKLILFQHGVAREISTFCDYLVPFLEGANSDIFITYNETSKRLYSDYFLNSARNFDVGISKDYYIRSKSIDEKEFPEILYNFTGVYSNQRLISRGLIDFEIADFEISILNKIFKNLPHTVMFKTYPNTWDYPDKDPILEVADNIDNIVIYDKNVDSRFLMHRSKVIVTSRLTSTLSWSIMSGKPIVFFNIDDECFWRNDAMKLMKDSIIFFDKKDKDFYSKVHSFLKKPIEEIEFVYSQKIASRQKFIQKYISSNKDRVGKKISKILSNI